MLTISGAGTTEERQTFRALQQRLTALCIVLGMPGNPRASVAKLANRVAQNHPDMWEVVWLKDAIRFLGHGQCDDWDLKGDSAAVFLGPVNHTVVVLNDAAAAHAGELSQAFSDAQ